MADMGTTSNTNSGGAGEAFFSVRRYERDGRLVIEAVGEISAGNADLLERALGAGLEEAVLPVTFDLRRVGFIERSGMAVLARASKRLRSPGTPRAPRVAVTPAGQPDRVLRIWTLDTILEIVDGLDPEGAR